MGITRLYDINYDPASPDYVGGVSPPGAIKKLDENQKQIFSEFNNYLGDGTLRLPFSQTPIYVNGQDLMSRTFYVDAVNGDDNNPGTSGAPFKTLKKAIDSVPVGGYGLIYLAGQEFVMNKPISLYNKVVKLLSIDTSNKAKLIWEPNTYTHNSQTYYYYPYHIGMSNSAISFYFVDLELRPRDDTSIPWTSGGVAFFCNYHAGMNSLRFYHCNITIHGFGLASGRDCAFMSVYCFGCNINDEEGAVLHVNNGAGCVVNIGSSITNGNWANGIVRDANGTPRNVMSNIVL